MHFNLVDAVLERTATSILTIKQVSLAEEYLQDHFAGFPVLPGVLMLESMVQAARELVDASDVEAKRPARRLVLGTVRALKYGTFVRPGYSIRVSVALHKCEIDALAIEFKGEATLIGPGGAAVLDAAGEPAVAVAGRFVLRALRVESGAVST